MAVNDCDVIRQGVEPRADGLGIAARTEVVGAKPRDRLGRLDPVRAAEKREEVLRMVREDGGATSFRPVRSAGTACEVFASTVTVFRYQVDSRAKAAKAGKRAASISP